MNQTGCVYSADAPILRATQDVQSIAFFTFLARTFLLSLYSLIDGLAVLAFALCYAPLRS